MDLGRKILEIRKSKGLSQTEFAEKFNITRQTVSNWENGKNFPDMETLMRICDEYDIALSELFMSDKELIRSLDRRRRVTDKRALVFMLIGVLIVVTVLVALMPGMVSKFFYDPTQVVATADDGGGVIKTTRLELDARVYSELYLPQLKYEFAESVPLGFGKYDFSLEESTRIEPSKAHEVSGRIERNHIQIYDPSEFKSTDDGFVWDVEVDGDINEWMHSDIAELDDSKRYIAYITLYEEIEYESACKWIDQYGTGFPWALIVTGEDKGYAEPLGIYTDYIGAKAVFDNEKYPYLLRFREPLMDDPYSEPPYIEEYAKKHFISMLRYEMDNPEFMKMVEGNIRDDEGKTIKEWTEDKIRYVEKNGLRVHGFAVDATKEMLLDIVDSGKVCYITTQDNS